MRHAENIIGLMYAEKEFDARMDAEARAGALRLIQRYLGSDQKVINVSDFFSALVESLRAAREQGQVDCSGQMGIS